MKASLSSIEREELRRGSGVRWPLGFVVLTLAVTVTLPRLGDRRIARLRDEINEVATPARRHVSDIQLQLAITASQLRGQLLLGAGSMHDALRSTQAKRLVAEREVTALAGQLDPANALEIPGTVERLVDLGHQIDSLVAVDAAREATPTMIAEQRRRFLEAEALGDTVGMRIDHAAANRRDAIAETETRVSRLTGLSLLLGLVATVVIARLGARFRAMALRLDESEQRARAIAEQERTARAAVERHQQELERVTESRARLLRGFTHDVKNPLGAADGYLALVEDRVYGEIPEQAASAVVRVRRSIGQALELIKALLDIARAEAGELEIRRAQLDVREAVRDVVEAFAAQAAAREIAITSQLPPEPLLAHTDGARVRQVVGNLVSNAVKYTPAGGHVIVCADTRADIVQNGRRSAAIVVDDDGPGIPAEKLPMLFKEFSRFDPQLAEGAGVGLAISQRIAAALGGRIAFENREGGGSQFTLILPLGDRRKGNPNADR
jgi:signal transduction histidine kinase